MKALFCHDHYYYRDDDIFLSKGQYHYTIWTRYLNHFDTITVVGRDGGAGNANEKNINVSSADNVDFQLFENINSLRGMILGRQKIRDNIVKLVAAHDVIILRGTSELGAIAFAEAKRQGKIIAMEIVSCAWDELWYYGSIKAKLYAPYRFLKQRYYARHADAVIYVSQNFLQKRYPTKAPLVARASNVQISKFDFQTIKRKAKSHYKIGLIGTLKNKLKGVDVVIQAAQILHQKNISNFSIHILGPGDAAPFQSHLNELGLSNHVYFDGIRQSGADVFQWLRGMDLYIQPSFQEGVPRATIEAMAQSLPVVGSDAGGIPELIDSEFIVKRGDAKALAEAIERFILNPDLMAAQGVKNYETALKFTDDKLSAIRQDFWGNVKTMAVQNLPK